MSLACSMFIERFILGSLNVHFQRLAWRFAFEHILGPSERFCKDFIIL
eukprot:UN22773